MKKLIPVINVIVTLGLLITLLKISEFILRPSNTDQCIAAVDAFHAMPENSIDVIIYGSSHGWRGVDSTEMYEQYGIGAYNYGGNWQRLSTEALFFYDSLRTQSPKIALMETFRINEVIADQDLDGEIYYTRSISDFPYKRQYLRQAFGSELERWVAYYFPLSQFHSRWNNIKIGYFKKWYTKEEFMNTMGYYYVKDTVQPVSLSDPETFEQLELSPDATEILDGIVQTCKENDIQLIFFTTPYQGEYNYSEAMQEYAQQNGCDYLDLFYETDEIGLDENTDFDDDDHLNHSGATKVADYLGQYIKDRYELQDMRTVEDNLWEGKNGNRTGIKYVEWCLEDDDK